MDSLKDTLIINNLFDTQSLLDNLEWEQMKDGVSICKLYEAGDQGPVAALLHYQTGASMPEHQHMGYEHILILRGAQRDERHLYPAGTLSIQPPGVTHSIHAESGCIALAIWEKPVQFTPAT